jgi:single-strand DNA-binding protein
MYSLNRATVIGNITRDPELRTTPNGQMVTSFSVATNRRWKNQGSNEYQEATEYHDVVAWGKSAEFISNYLKKGQKIYVDGRLQTRAWEAPDGAKQRRTEIILENFVPLTPKGEAGGAAFDNIDDLAGGTVETGPAPKKAAPKAAPAPAEDEINLEDIPF